MAPPAVRAGLLVTRLDILARTFRVWKRVTSSHPAKLVLMRRRPAMQTTSKDGGGKDGSSKGPPKARPVQKSVGAPSPHYQSLFPNLLLHS